MSQFNSVTRSSDFWKLLAINFHTKVAQILIDFLGYFENMTFRVNTVVATFDNFWNYWATFYFKVCSETRTATTYSFFRSRVVLSWYLFYNISSSREPRNWIDHFEFFFILTSFKVQFYVVYQHIMYFKLLASFLDQDAFVFLVRLWFSLICWKEGLGCERS